ncbi:MAG: hypothetical protein QOE11_3324 [Solirubrobacteraceae bacterium]|jgi:8-oxo-dGTP pyrophosphatase MutT (NUDIX family)|nr:hypothetical protein [Solirubrobacteraceae bacterium]
MAVKGLGAALRRLARAAPRRQVVAAVPVRPRAGGGLEFLLVRTRSGSRWTFPKGGCERGETPGEAAAREAVEEAGASGRISPTALARYRYGEDRVAAFLLEVTCDGARAEHGRDPTWFGFEAARRKLAEGRGGAFGEEMERVLIAAERAVTR